MVRTDVLIQELGKREVPMPSVQSDAAGATDIVNTTTSAAGKRKADNSIAAPTTGEPEEELDVFQQRLKASCGATKGSA